MISMNVRNFFSQSLMTTTALVYAGNFFSRCRGRGGGFQEAGSKRDVDVMG